MPLLEKGQIADFILFDINKTWTFNEKTNASKARNSMMYNKDLRGKVIATYFKNNLQTF